MELTTMSHEKTHFNIYPVPENHTPPPKSVTDSLEECIPAIIEHYLPGQKIEKVIDRGTWGRRVFEVGLTSGEAFMVKFRIYAEWLYGANKSRAVYNLLHPRGLCVTEELATDETRTLAPVAFTIEKKARGTRLDRLLNTTPKSEWRVIYQAIGRHYRGLHGISMPRAGYWLDDPDKPFNLHPCDFYLQNDIGGENGSGYKLVEMGFLPISTLERVIEAWRIHLEELKSAPVALVHGTATTWTIYLEKNSSSNEYRVSRMGADDLASWDPAYDLAMLRWPPLSDIRIEDWQALVQAYGPLPHERRFLLYRLMQSLITACWAYMGPKTPDSDQWLEKFRQNLDTNMNNWVDQIENIK